MASNGPKWRSKKVPIFPLSFVKELGKCQKGVKRAYFGKASYPLNDPKWVQKGCTKLGEAGRHLLTLFLGPKWPEKDLPAGAAKGAKWTKWARPQ